MPREPRKIYENAILNVTIRGNNKKIIFRKDKDYVHFKNLMFEYKMRFDLVFYHYCLMRNHFHALLKVLNPLSLPQAMHGLQLAYGRYFVKRYGYVGRFWQGRYHSKVVEDDKYLLTAGLYIESNPVKAGLVRHPADYKWSSYNVYANGAKDTLITLDPYYLALHDDDETRQRMYEEMMLAYMEVENVSS